MDQQQMMQIQMIEEESSQLNQHLEIINQNIAELEELNSSLIEIDKAEGNEILANLGKRIYIPVEIKDKKLVVEVGKGVFVKKSIKDTTKIIVEQIEKLNLAKDKIGIDLEALNDRVSALMEDYERAAGGHSGKPKNCKGHDCDCDHCEDDDCECEE